MRFLGVVGFCRLRTVTIAASRVWAFSTLRGLSWMVHVLLVGTWPSRSCVIDSAMSNLAESLCLCRDPAFVPAPGAPLHPVESEVIWGLRSGLPQEESLTPQALRSRWGLPLERAGTSAERGTPPVSFGAPPDDQMSIAASEGELSLSGDDDSAALPPSGVVALSEPDPEMTAMLSRAAENVGLVWNPPPRPDPSRLDEWFLGGGRAGSQRPPPVPFFPEVHWGAYKIVEGTFHCPKQILWLLRPHHPRWWGCFGVHGHPLGGAVCGHATVSNSRYHPAGWSVSPLTGL